tara:strand:+ start:68 stop:574 length:507 start_codon:yes stop_codon:yes gene_type:complete
MENENINKSNFFDKALELIKNKKTYFISFLLIILLILSLFAFFKYYQDLQNNKISENYIKAGLYLTSGDREKSKLAYKDIILSKNKFYSILALNNIIENNLEKEKDEILKLFEVIENLKIEKEQLNLVKLKKALFLIDISLDDEGNKLLNEIITSNSIWKDAALEILK